MRLTAALSKLSPSSTKLRILIVTLLILTVPVILYYTYYVRNQTAYFTSRDFRKLALISSQVGTKVESLSVVFKNAAEKSALEAKSYDSKAKQKNLEELNQNLKILKEDGLEIKPFDFDSSDQKPIDRNAGHSSRVTIEVRPDDGARWLYLDFVYEMVGNKKVWIRAKTDFNNLIMPLVDQRTIENPTLTEPDDEFDNVLIAQAGPDTRIIFQQDTSEFRLSSLEKLTSTAADPKLDVGTIDKISSVTDVKLAGSDFKAFLHPINLSLAPANETGAQGVRWILCGLIRSDRFRKEAWSISYTLLIAFAFISALSILSWPFLKLVLIGPKDRLRTADIYFLSFSMLIGVALVTTIGLYAYTYIRDEYKMNSQLEVLAPNIKDNFQAEVAKALEELRSLDSDLLTRINPPKTPTKAPKTPTKAPEIPPIKAASTNQKLTDRNKLLADMLEATHPYPYFDTAVWINPDGSQKFKWTFKNYTTQLIDVSARSYFTNPKEGRFRRLGGYEYWLEPILSKTTGRNEVEISHVVPRKLAGEDYPGWISAFDARLISVMQPVLPSGYGYTIINNDGTVLFHSDEIHHLGENFFQECDNNTHLLSAVLGRAEVQLNVRYMGRGHRLFTTPVENYPTWTLIVFRDKQVLRTVFLELLTLASGLFFLYSLILLIPLSIFYLININTTDRREWMWPAEGLTFVYCRSMLFLLLFAVIAASLIIWWGGLWSVILVSLISVIGISGCFLNLKFQPWKELKIAQPFEPDRQWPGKNFLSYDRAYALNLVLLLLLTAIVPSVAFFKFAYESEIKLLITHGQMTIANGLRVRQARITSRYMNRGQKIPEESLKRFIDRRLSFDWDIYAKFFFNTVKEPADSRHPKPSNTFQDEVLNYMNGFMPRPNRFSIESRELAGNSLADTSRYWEDAGPNKMLMHVSGEESAKSGAYHLITKEVPFFAVPPLPGALVLLFVLLVMLYSLRRIVRTVFLLDHHKPSSSSFKNLLEKETQNNLFVILDIPHTNSEQLKSPQFHCIDIKEFANKPDWAANFDYKSLPTDKTKIIALDHFDYKMNEPERNRQRTSFLERLLDRKQRIVVLSTAEPTRYRFVKGSGNDPDAFGGSPVDGADRWSGVISRFQKCYAEDSGDPDSFKEKLDAKTAEILDRTSAAGKGDLKKLPRLFDTLEEECSPKAPLQHIGLEILNQSGFEELSKDHLINRIGTQAGTYYQDIWQCCSNEERLTLFHLAQDRFLSPKDHDIEPLMRRGLVVHNPDLHLMNESFKRFVKNEKGAQVIANYEQTARADSPWHTFKVPLLAILAGVVVFLFVTQRDLYDSSLAIMTAVTTAIPAFFKLLGLFQKDPASRSGQKSFFGRTDT